MMRFYNQRRKHQALEKTNPDTVSYESLYAGLKVSA